MTRLQRLKIKYELLDCFWEIVAVVALWLLLSILLTVALTSSSCTKAGNLTQAGLAGDSCMSTWQAFAIMLVGIPTTIGLILLGIAFVYVHMERFSEWRGKEINRLYYAIEEEMRNPTPVFAKGKEVV